MLHLIVEGGDDAAILDWGLPASFVSDHGIQLRIAQGKDSAAALARTLLAAKYEPVFVVADADTLDPSHIRRERMEWEDSLRRASPGVPFGVYLAAPQVEASLFEVPEVLLLLPPAADWGEVDEHGIPLKPKGVLRMARNGGGIKSVLHALKDSDSAREAWRKSRIGHDIITAAGGLLKEVESQGSAHLR